jgi:hypothetical protein
MPVIRATAGGMCSPWDSAMRRTCAFGVALRARDHPIRRLSRIAVEGQRHGAPFARGMTKTSRTPIRLSATAARRLKAAQAVVDGEIVAVD